jgi:hypothetical protein
MGFIGWDREPSPVPGAWKEVIFDGGACCAGRQFWLSGGGKYVFADSPGGQAGDFDREHSLALGGFGEAMKFGVLVIIICLEKENNNGKTGCGA